MKRELGIARCGLACCLCSENNTCHGCGSGECPDKAWCENLRCSKEKGLMHCYECSEDCRKGLLSKIKPYGFTLFAKRFGEDMLTQCLERNEERGVVYHRRGLTGDYDCFDDEEKLISFILNGNIQSEGRDNEDIGEVCDKKRYLDLLLIGDEQEEMIDRYLHRGNMFVLSRGGKVLAQCVVTDEGGGVLEIKNISVYPAFRGKGCGKALIEFIAKKYSGSFHTLRAGTGDSPMTVPFYEKCGFVCTGCIKNFFTENYDHPMYECGVRLVDMIIFERKI